MLLRGVFKWFSLARNYASTINNLCGYFTEAE